MMCLHMKWTAHVACNVNFLTETERLFITGSHVYCKSGNILEMVQDGDIVTVHH